MVESFLNLLIGMFMFVLELIGNGVIKLVIGGCNGFFGRIGVFDVCFFC